MLALGVLAVVSSDASAAYRSPAWAIAMGIAAIAALSAGAGWVLLEGQRVGRVEVQWLVEHPDGPTPGCPESIPLSLLREIHSSGGAFALLRCRAGVFTLSRALVDS